MMAIGKFNPEKVFDRINKEIEISSSRSEDGRGPYFRKMMVAASEQPLGQVPGECQSEHIYLSTSIRYCILIIQIRLSTS